MNEKRNGKEDIFTARYRGIATRFFFFVFGKYVLFFVNTSSPFSSTCSRSHHGILVKNVHYSGGKLAGKDVRAGSLNAVREVGEGKGKNMDPSMEG